MVLTIDEIKTQFPDEWVLIGNPQMDAADFDVVAGIPLYHSKDKKEVCYLGREKIAGYQDITVIYTGVLRHTRKITSIFNRVQQ